MTAAFPKSGDPVSFTSRTGRERAGIVLARRADRVTVLSDGVRMTVPRTDVRRPA